MAVQTRASPPSNLLAPANTNILSYLSPALTHSLYLAAFFQRLLSTTTLFVFIRAYLLSAIILRQSFYASAVLLMQSYYTSVLISRQLLLASQQTTKLGWKATEGLRKKLAYEFMIFVLGSGGNGFILLVFWPGWIVVGGGIWGVRWVCG